MTKLSFEDVLGQESKQNPSRLYGRLGEQGPLSSIADFGGMGVAWIVTNYEDVLLRRLPHIWLSYEPEQLPWNRKFALCGLTHLPVTF